MTTADIKDLMLYGERINIEYKEAAGDLPKSLWETYSAFANTTRNVIVSGINSNKKLLSEMPIYYGAEAYRALALEERTMIAYVWNGESSSNAELQQLLGLNSIEVGKILHQMVEKQLLNKGNKSRWTTYTLLKENFADSISEEKASDKRGDKKTDVIDRDNVEGGQKKDKMTIDTILHLIKEKPDITRKVLAETIGISQSAVQKHINRLKAEQIIIRHGGDRGGYWEILE